MATPNIARKFHLKGRLVKNPGATAGTYPYGGTELGVVRDGFFTVGQEESTIRAEEFGSIVIDKLVIREVCAMSVVFGEWDKDAVETVFTNMATPASSSTKWGDDITMAEGRVSGATVLPGTLRSGQSLKLLFVPDEPAQHLGIILFNALPMLDVTRRIRLVIAEAFGLGAVFQGIPNSNHRTHQMGPVPLMRSS